MHNSAKRIFSLQVAFVEASYGRRMLSRYTLEKALPKLDHDDLRNQPRIPRP